MAVKYAKAFGCEVTVLSRSENKRAETMAMGADHFLLSTDEEAVKVGAWLLGAAAGVCCCCCCVHGCRTRCDGAHAAQEVPRGAAVLLAPGGLWPDACSS
jgi:hypothetical protein